MTVDPGDALLELRELVAGYLEGSDDAPRAADLLDILEDHLAQTGPVPPNREAIVQQQLDQTTKTWFVSCVICGERVELVGRKDFESSFSVQEYRDHIAKKHPDA